MRWIRQYGIPLLRRLGSSVLTLWLITIVVFAMTNVLPGDVARRILGPFADERAVAALNHQLGTDRPLPEQYIHWLSRLAHGDLGTSLAMRRPVAQLLLPALANSAKLAGSALLVILPLSIFLGLVAAFSEGKALDFLIRLSGLVTTVLPEFVTSIAVILLFAIAIPLFPVTAVAPPHSSLPTQIYYLILPITPVTLVLVGYLCRVMRSSAVEILHTNYIRAAELKGLSRWRLLFWHLLPNALPPVIAVTANQLGYLLGGLVAIEAVFNYPGLGQLLLTAGRQKDFPVLQSGVLLVGLTYVLANTFADLLYWLLNPRLRERG
ncbi:ABC transporter permease [Thermorudis peleae]|uniref:ABC transporter permease n=1 Tax=Thermorudis peleae TaxID=1382356 RepID=UPI00068E111E|nr:ABC transporter permease [Thermorudis peleae]